MREEDAARIGRELQEIIDDTFGDSQRINEWHAKAARFLRGEEQLDIQAAKDQYRLVLHDSDAWILFGVAIGLRLAGDDQQRVQDKIEALLAEREAPWSDLRTAPWSELRRPVP